jgi:hypothetical protein
MCRLTVSQPQQEAAVNSHPSAESAHQLGGAARAAPQQAQQPDAVQAVATKQCAAQARPLPLWLKAAAATAAQRQAAPAAGSRQSADDQANSAKGSNAPAQDPGKRARCGPKWAAAVASDEPESSLASHTPLPAVELAAARQPTPTAAAGIALTRAAEPAVGDTVAAALLPGTGKACMHRQIG